MQAFSITVTTAVRRFWQGFPSIEGRQAPLFREFGGLFSVLGEKIAAEVWKIFRWDFVGSAGSQTNMVKSRKAIWHRCL